MHKDEIPSLTNGLEFNFADSTTNISLLPDSMPIALNTRKVGVASTPHRIYEGDIVTQTWGQGMVNGLNTHESVNVSFRPGDARR